MVRNPGTYYAETIICSIGLSHAVSLLEADSPTMLLDKEDLAFNFTPHTNPGSVLWLLARLGVDPRKPFELWEPIYTHCAHMERSKKKKKKKSEIQKKNARRQAGDKIYLCHFQLKLNQSWARLNPCMSVCLPRLYASVSVYADGAMTWPARSLFFFSPAYLQRRHRPGDNFRKCLPLL